MVCFACSKVPQIELSSNEHEVSDDNIRTGEKVISSSEYYSYARVNEALPHMTESRGRQLLNMEGSTPHDIVILKPRKEVYSKHTAVGVQQAEASADMSHVYY